MMILPRKARTAARLLVRALRRRLRPTSQHPGAPPRVLVVTEAEGATLHYRVLNQIEQLDIAGIASACADPRYLGLTELLARCDLLFLYRLHDSPRSRAICAAARKHRMAIVYDTDDLIWDQRLVEYCALDHYYSASEVASFRKHFTSAEAIMAQADAFVASTPYLADLISARFDKPTYVNQNALARATVARSGPLFERCAAAIPAERLTIAYFSGWARTHEIDLAVALPGIERALAELPHARLRIVGHFDAGRLPERLRPRVELAPYVPYERLIETIADVDINLAPIVDNPHRRAKSGVKFLEAALVGVPTIASDLEPYRLIQHGETGMLAADEQGWYTSIMALAHDPVLCRSIGRAAREQVLAEHTTDARAPHFAALLRGIAAAQRA